MIVLGGNYQVVNERFGDTHMFIGHRIMYEILRTRKFGYEYDPGVYVYYNLDVSRFRFDTIKEQMINDYPFLKHCIVDEPGLGVNVISSEYENLFSSIKDHNIYTQGVNVVSLITKTHV
jgi:hypothetical protein